MSKLTDTHINERIYDIYTRAMRASESRQLRTVAEVSAFVCQQIMLLLSEVAHPDDKSKQEKLFDDMADQVAKVTEEN